MFNVWTSAGLWFSFFCLLSLVTWAAAGPVWGLLLLVALLLLTVIRQLRQLSRFLAWAREPAGTQPPDSSGLWELLFATLTKRVRAANALRDELTGRLQRFREAGEAMPDGVLTIGPGHTIDWFNATAAIHFDLHHGTDNGAPLTNLVRRPELVARLDGAHGAEPLVLRPTRPQQPTLAVQVIEFGEGQKLILSRDITQLERLERMRSDFVANVSHELKTPLTVVVGFIETLLDFDGQLAPDDTRNYLQMALDQASRMQHLVEDLLTLSGLETDGHPAHDEPVDVPVLVAEVAQETEALSAGRHHIAVEAGPPATLTGSSRELHSAFTNLASNAVRYTPEGGHIQLSWRLGKNGELDFCVADDGIGIDAEHIPRLTERFYRVDRGRSRDSGGTGLGLAIVKHVMTRHQGELRVDSTPGRGSCFTTRFPARRVAAAAPTRV